MSFQDESRCGVFQLVMTLHWSELYLSIVPVLFDLIDQDRTSFGSVAIPSPNLKTFMLLLVMHENDTELCAFFSYRTRHTYDTASLGKADRARCVRSQPHMEIQENVGRAVRMVGLCHART